MAILDVGDLNTTQIRALDRSRTVVLFVGGMLEEHGPYLPAFTDGILSARLADEVARTIASQKADWTVLRFPTIGFGASGSNEIGGQFTFPGTFVVRPSTLRAVFMDLAGEIGDQGFRWAFVVHVHGSPMHIRALDDAGDYFNDTYGGRMVNLWGLVPVLAGWGNALAILSDEERREDGASLHGGLDEHSMMLYLRPDLVAAGYKTAAPVTGRTAADAFEAAKQGGWPGYIGSPRRASAAMGERIWKGFSAAAGEQAVKILDGADPSAIQRYADLLFRNPVYQDGWIKPATARDEARGAAHREWLSRRRP